MNSLRRWMIRLLVVVGVVLILYGTREKTLPWAARWLDVGTAPQPADYVLVLGGGYNTRPFAAAALVKAGLARHVLVSHTKASPEVLSGSQPASDEVARKVLIARGVKSEGISILGKDNDNTYDEARSLAAMLEKLSSDVRVLILTSDFHTRRARWIFRQILGPRSSQISMVSAPSDEFCMDRWWQSEMGFQTIASENLKFLLYVVYYGRWARVILGIVVLVAIAIVIRRKRGSGKKEPTHPISSVLA